MRKRETKIKYEDELSRTILKWESIKNTNVNKRYRKAVDKSKKVRSRSRKKIYKAKAKEERLIKKKLLYGDSDLDDALIRDDMDAELTLVWWLHELTEKEHAKRVKEALKVSERRSVENKSSNLGNIVSVKDKTKHMWALKAKRMLAEAQLLTDTKLISREYFIDRMSEMAYALYEYGYIEYDIYFSFLDIKDFSKVKLNKKDKKDQTKKK